MEKRLRRIETERLILREIGQDDRPSLLRLFYNEEVKKTFMIPDFASREEADRLFERMAELSRQEDRFVYGAELCGELIGFINEVWKEDRAIELGYVVSPEHKAKGLCTEMLKAAIAELFRIGFTSVRAACFEENIASRRVMEKSGMHRAERTEDVEYRGMLHHCLCFEIDRED